MFFGYLFAIFKIEEAVRKQLQTCMVRLCQEVEEFYCGSFRDDSVLGLIKRREAANLLGVPPRTLDHVVEDLMETYIHHEFM